MKYPDIRTEAQTAREQELIDYIQYLTLRYSQIIFYVDKLVAIVPEEFQGAMPHVGRKEL